MKEFLSSNEHLSFKRIENIINTRQKYSLLILLGADSDNLSNTLEDELLKIKNSSKFLPKSDYILKELIEQNNNDTKIINLFKYPNIKNVLKNLQFTRDYISEYGLKIVFIFDKNTLESIKEKYYDFYSINSYDYQYSDNSYQFDQSQVKQNDKLSNAIAKYENYKNSHNKPQPKILVQMLFSVALEAHNISNLDLALKYYQEALNITNKYDNLKYEHSAILGNLGLIYRDLGDLKLAIKYHKEALQIHKEIGNLGGTASDLGNLGGVYQVKGDLELAIKYHKEALEIDKEIGNLGGTANQLGNLG
jgi:tetratricopeptide (TPR) repeat protein